MCYYDVVSSLAEIACNIDFGFVGPFLLIWLKTIALQLLIVCSPPLVLALVSSMLSERLLVSPLVKLAVEERSQDHGIRQASERRTTDIKMDS